MQPNDLNIRARATVAKAADLLRDYIAKTGAQFIIYESVNDSEKEQGVKDCSVSLVFFLKEGN